MARRKRRMKMVGAFAAVLAITAMAPAMASAQGKGLGDLLDGILGGGGGDEVAAPKAGAPPNYTPPLHGTDPHGQGTVGVVDLTPSNTAPLPGDPADGDEEITIGDSDGGQSGGAYNGRVTLLHLNLLGLINESVVEVETTEGQTNNGPLAPLQDAIDDICTDPALAQAAGCISLLPINSESTATGSENSFGVASVDLDLPVPGAPVGLQAGAASSEGNISETGSCQTATGSSNVANADVGLLALPNVTADALSSSSSSTACADGTSSQTNDSNVVNLMGTGLGAPAAGCADGTANTQFPTVPNPLIAVVCNATDSNGGQNGSPYGVREALTVFALIVGNPTLRAAVSGPESHAVAPATPGGQVPEDPTAGGPGTPGDGTPGGPGDGSDDPGGPVTTTAQPGDGELAFTGANLAVLALLGGALVLAGGAIATSSARHRRAAA
jgi:hypothetical protein